MPRAAPAPAPLRVVIELFGCASSARPITTNRGRQACPMVWLPMRTVRRAQVRSALTSARVDLQRFARPDTPIRRGAHADGSSSSASHACCCCWPYRSRGCIHPSGRIQRHAPPSESIPPRTPAPPRSESLTSCRAPRVGRPSEGRYRAAAHSMRRMSAPSPSSGWTPVCSRSRSTPAR